MHKIIVPASIRECILADLNNTLLGASHESGDLLPLMIEEQRFDIELNELEEQIEIELKGKTLLEVGCGYGMSVVHGRLNRGLNIFGVEPSKNGFEGRYEIAAELLRQNELADEFIRCGTGEAIPFPDESFDIVFSFQVLEHVINPEQVIRESARVLRPGGVLYINAPNYHSFYEGHYCVPWFPGLGKRLGTLYLRLIGRDPQYLLHLNFLSKSYLERIILNTQSLEVINDYGLKEWIQWMQNISFDQYSRSQFERLVLLADHLHLLGLLRVLGSRFNFQGTLRVLARKQ